MENDNFDTSMAEFAAQAAIKRSRLGTLEQLRIAAKRTEKEIEESSAQGKGEGLRTALLHPHGIYADVLSQPLFG